MVVLIDNEITISGEVLIVYHNRMKNKIFKALAIFEGRDYQSKKVTMPKDEALREFQKYTNNLVYEISGCKRLFEENEKYVSLLALIVELHTRKNHKDVKNIVFMCINIIDAMIGSINKNIEGEL